MKKLFLLIVILTICISNIYAVDFLDIPINEAIKKAKQENKKVLLYFTADWCGPCKYMDKFVFKNDTVKTYLIEHYIAIKINESTWKGEKLAKKFMVNSYPTFIVLNKEGVKVKRFVGQTSVKGFVAQISDLPLSIQEIEEQRTFINVNVKKSIKPEIGFRVGVLNSQISTLNIDNRIGTEFDVFVALESGRFLLRPALGFISVGNSNTKLNYISTSIDLGATVKRSTIFGLPGGYRIVLSPYYSFLQNANNQEFSNNDFGLKYGIAAFIGSDSKIELQIFGSSGFKDIQNNIDNKQTNQTLGISCGLTF